MKHSHLFRLISLCLGAMLMSAASALAQQPPQAPAGQGQQGRGGAPLPPMTNLRILPKDMPRPEVQARMQIFEQALGVNCTYCHVNEGRGGRVDFATDEKPTKNTARVMMHLVDDINTKLA